MRIFEPCDIARVLDYRHLQAKTNTEIRYFILTRILHRHYLAFDTALAETAWDQYRVHSFEDVCAFVEHIGGIDIGHFYFRASLDAGMGNRLVKRFIGIQQLHVFANHGEVNLALRMQISINNSIPFR